MNKFLKSIAEEEVLFFDTELCRRSRELYVDSKEFELFQRKIRNKETDELLPEDQVIEQYSRRGALKMCYSTIVSVGLAFIKSGEVHMKSIEGTEEEIIRQFCKIASQFTYLAGSNIIKFDLPLLVNNGYKYFDVCENLPDKYIVSGKRQWELKHIIDIQDIFQGTHYASSSLDEMCYHFGLPSPKTDIDGSKVSDEYWENGVEKISEYVKRDVFACVNVFKRMRFEKPFESYIDKNKINPIEDLKKTKKLTSTIISGLKSKAKELKNKKERTEFVEMIKALLQKTKFSEEEKSLFKALIDGKY